MSLGLQFLQSVITSGNPGHLRLVQPQFFIAGEDISYNFIATHVRRHRALPSRITLRERGIQLAAAPELPAYYAERVRQRFIYNLINSKLEPLSTAMRGRDAEEAFRIVQELSVSGSHILNPTTFTTLAQAAMDLVADYDMAKEVDGLRGITLGFPSLDRVTLGGMPEDLITIGGRPSMGKSWILAEMCYQAWRAGHVLVYVTMEMGNLQVTRRMIGRMLGTNPNLIRSGKLSFWAEQAFRDQVLQIADMPPVYLLSGDMNKSTDDVRQLVEEHEPDMVYIDASYLISPSKPGRYNSKQEAASQAQKEIKGIAKERPVAQTAQLNRGVRNDSQESADMGDLAGTDSLGQDSSIIVALRKGPPPFEDSSRVNEVIKNREGEVTSYRTHHCFSPVCFEEMPEEGTVLLDDEWEA